MPPFLKQLGSLLQLPAQLFRTRTARNRQQQLQQQLTEPQPGQPTPGQFPPAATPGQVPTPATQAPPAAAPGAPVAVGQQGQVAPQVPSTAVVPAGGPATPIPPPTGAAVTPTPGAPAPVAGGAFTQEQTAQLQQAGVSQEQISQLQQVTAIQQVLSQETPEQREQREGIQATLERLIPLQQQLVEAQAPAQDIAELEAEIGTRQRELARLTPEGLTAGGVFTGGTAREIVSRGAAAARAPVQTELTELLFQRSALGQRREQQLQAAQTAATQARTELELRQAIAGLTPQQPALPAAVQEGIFEQIIPETGQPVKGVTIQEGGRTRLINPVTGETIRDFGPIKATPGGVGPGSISREELTPLARAIFDGTIKLTDITPTQRANIAPELNAVGYTSVIKTEDRQSILTIKKGLESVIAKWKEVPGRRKGQLQGRFQALTGGRERNEDVQAFESARAIVGQQLTRLFEKGRLSDQDRLFYQGLMPNLNQGSLSVVEAAQKSLVEQLDNQLTNQITALEEDAASVFLQDPTTGEIRRFENLSGDDLADAQQQGFQVVNQ